MNCSTREKHHVDAKEFNLPLKRMTLNQQRDACQAEIEKLKEENMQLGLEVARPTDLKMTKINGRFMKQFSINRIVLLNELYCVEVNQPT